jgi:transcriptional regulator with XRE-family HTH domain
MSRRELAKAVNAHVYLTTGRVTAMDAQYVGRLERGQRRWPSAEYRNAFREVLGVSADSELGFRPPDWEARNTPAQRGRLRMKMETIRFASRNEDEAYFYRTMHHLAAGCLLLGARDEAVTAVLEVMGRAVGERQERRRQSA